MESEPGALAATEDPHPISPDLERLRFWVHSSGIGGPDAPHLPAPHWFEVCGDGFEVVVDKGSMQEINAVPICSVVLLESLHRTWGEEHVGVTAEDRLTPGFNKDPVL